MEKIKYIKVRETPESSKLNLKQIIKGVILASVISILFLLVAAVVFTYTDISMSLVKIISTIVFYFGALISGMIASIRQKSYGWLHGIIAGVIYTLLIFCVNVLADTSGTKIQFPLFKIILSVAVAGIGGIIGVNLKIYNKKR